MSDQPASLAAALVQLQAKLPKIVKNATGQIQSRTYQYATLASIHEIVMPMLTELGLCWICCPTLNQDGQFVLSYELRWNDEVQGGEYPLGTGTAQQLGSAITYARRYALCAVLGLVADDDDDGTAASTAAEWQPPASPRTRKADRHHAGRSGPLPDDDWTDSAPDETPGSITAGRATELGYWFTKAGITSSKDRLSYAQARLDRPELTESAQLSEADGIKLAALLKEETR